MTERLNTEVSQQGRQTRGIKRLCYLSERHYVMFNERSRDGFGIFTVISNDYGDGRIVSSHAVDKILQLVVP